MDKIAIISDMHSNIVALKSVLKDIENRGIKRIFCAGDVSLKGSSPCECFDIVNDKCEIIVKGNVEDCLINYENPTIDWYRDKLGQKRIDVMKKWNYYHDFYMSGSLIRMFHSTKSNPWAYIYDFDNVDVKKKMFEDENNVNPDIVLYAHIHIQYLQKFYNKTLVNIGSVSNAVEILNHDESIQDMRETTQSYYTIIEGEYGEIEKNKHSLSIQLVRVPYNINEELELAKKNKVPQIEDYIQELTTAKYRKNTISQNKSFEYTPPKLANKI